MQQRRQLRRRSPPPAPPTSAVPVLRTGLGAVLVAVLCLASGLAQETSPSASTPADNATVTTSQCKCAGNSTLNCSSLNLTSIEEKLNTCNQTVVRIDVSNNLFDSVEDLIEWYDVELNASFNSIRIINSNSLKISLEVLDVSGNQISELELGDANSLTHLNASHNQLERVEALPNPCELQWLDLSHNSLKEIPEGFTNCRKLKMFDASNNTLRAFPKDAFDAFLSSDEDDGWTALLVDLRGNNLTSDDLSLRSFLEETEVTVNEDDCACANLTRGRASFTLCVTTMCVDGTHYWTSAAPTTSSPSTLPDTFRVGFSGNETECEEGCASSTTSGAETSNDTSSTSASLPSSSDEVSATIFTSTTSSPITVPTSPPTTSPPRIAGAPSGPVGGSRRGGDVEGPVVTQPPRPSPTPPDEGPDPTPAPGRNGRRRRSLYVTLGLTLVVVVAAGAGAMALYTIYKRRRRQLLEEQAQRIALMPLVATTPRSLRAADDDFVP